ncbi:MAG: hypothetical protein ABIM54_05880, partial [candidate division WOR-3 bacterium]
FLGKIKEEKDKTKISYFDFYYLKTKKPFRKYFVLKDFLKILKFKKLIQNFWIEFLIKIRKKLKKFPY